MLTPGQETRDSGRDAERRGRGRDLDQITAWAVLGTHVVCSLRSLSAGLRGGGGLNQVLSVNKHTSIKLAGH